ncbi:FAD-dependent oxidoreductase [Nocardia suismassiliense]|uniref:FAD-dependent oxidoreductase n=1 Tax=Nocardia suismassiliense TaxID=2077092 RepID=UPI000D1FABFC|nr:FAD-dependent oxidoreductase [Nocardia suismassiliense]
MAYVITQRCCKDASCISECPVDCIRPTPDQAEYATAEILHIDPATCIDCGSCVPPCPVDAIFSEDDLIAPLRRYADINADYYDKHPLQPDITSPLPAVRRVPATGRKLRVAIVGAGPAASYAVEALLRRADAEIDVIEKLPTPGGLVRAGVAPDHPDTKRIIEVFDSTHTAAGVQRYFNVTVGEHISQAELLDHHHAVIYAVGTATDHRTGVPGEELPGSRSATEFVAWYNGHPDCADNEYDLTGDRAVIIGNGNVALDVARILTADPADLAITDISPPALEALRNSMIREVVLLGRRTPVHAAYTSTEFLALAYLPNVDVVIDESALVLDPISRSLLDDPTAAFKYALTAEYAATPTGSGSRRIEFRYLLSPVAYYGHGQVERVKFVHNEIRLVDGAHVAEPTGRTGSIETSLVLRSVGYRAQPIRDLPFDTRRAVVPNEQGRVIDSNRQPLRGLYVTGWVKRGAQGVIGTNRFDAEETVEHLVTDFLAGALAPPAGNRTAFAELLATRRPQYIDETGWHAIDSAERAAGQANGCPRVKFTDTGTILDIAAHKEVDYPATT